VVTLAGEILGKPRDPEHALAMLRRLAGRTHSVWTGVAVTATGGRVLAVQSVESRVTLRPALETELRAYVAGGEPLDKAGAYALQGEGRKLVSRVEGSESNVIGLPLEETLALLAAAGLEPPRAR
jgi:septum formation protein